MRDGIGLFPGLPEGFAAGFTTRASAPDALSSDEALERLRAALGASRSIRPKQVHGREVLEAPGTGDAILSGVPGTLVAVASADCVPIVLLDPVTGWTAAVHAGWRGTALRIVDAVLDALEARGVKGADLVAAFGPSISRDRYQVGPEVIDALRQAYEGVPVPDGAIVASRGDRSLLDVAAFDEALLRFRGVTRLQHAGLCTASRPDLPSYRRDGKGTGRILTGVVRLAR